MTWFHKWGKSPRTPTQSERLSLSTFEQRESPSALTDIFEAFVQHTSGQTVVNLPPDISVSGSWNSLFVFNAAPQILDFKAVVGANGQVTFSGRVVDDQAVAGDVVTITGDGIDLVATVGAGGTFSVSTTVNSQGDITVTAKVKDVFGNTSAAALTIFTPSATGGTSSITSADSSVSAVTTARVASNASPVLSNVRVTVGSGGIVNITGKVTDDTNPTGYTVQLNGSGVDTVTIVGSDGKFDTSFQRPSAGELTIKVKATDAAGAVSNEVLVLVPGA